MNSKIKFTIIAITFLVSLGFTKDVFAATQIFRSVGPGATAALASNTSPATNTITISNTNSTATFVTGLADNIGVGDAIVYDSDNSNTLTSADSIAFIHGRTSSTVYTIKTQAGASPTDLTANDTWAIYRAYTSLANAESGTKNSSIPITTFNGGDRDLVTNNEQWNIACYANGTTADATAVTIDGWNTDSDNFIRIYTPILSTEVGVNQRHIGKWDNTKYYLSNTSANSALEISDTNALIDGLQIDEASSAASKAGIYFNTAIVYNVKVSNNIIKGSGSSTGDTGIKFEAASAGSLGYAYNNIVYDFNDTDGAGIRNSGSNFTTYFYNNTVYGISGTGGFGISQAAGTVYVKNDVVQSSTDGYNGTFDASSDYNISDLAADAPGTNSKNSSNVEFVNETGRDFHLAQTDTAARQSGTNLTADANLPFSTDIDGQLRNPAGVGWDIGADEGTVEFTATVMESGGNFSTLSSWEGVVNSDLMADTTRVFAHGGITGTVAGGNTITGGTSSATATVVYATSTQILLSGIAVSNFQSGETLTSSASGTLVISDNGNPASAVAKIDGAWTSADSGTEVTVSGWTTGPDNYVKIYTTTVARHDGKWNAGAYRFETTDTIPIYARQGHIRVDGVQVDQQSIAVGVYMYAFYYDGTDAGTSDIQISNCIFKLTGASTLNSRGIASSNAISRGKVWNTVLYGAWNYGYQPLQGSSLFKLFNVTFYGNGGAGTGIRGAEVYNSAVFGWTDDFLSSTVYDSASDDGDGSTPVVPSDWSAVFVDYPNGDFHLKQTDTSLKNAGTDLSSYFTTDIDGATRTSVTAWDIGADEVATQIYRSVGPGATGLLDSDNSHNDLLNSITGGTATFEVAVADNIGVGDVLIYDSNASETITSADTLLFIHGRTDSTHYTVRTQTGAIPSDVAATNDTWQIYRAHISLANAEAGTINSTLSTMGFAAFNGGNRDLMINNEEWNITCYANGTTADTTYTPINDWVTGMYNFIKVYTPTNTNEVGVSQRHPGKWDDNKYKMQITGDSWWGPIHVRDDYIRIDGLQLDNVSNSDTSNPKGIYLQEVADVRISNNIIKATGSGTRIIDEAGIYLYQMTANSRATVYNNIVYGFGSGIIHDWGNTGLRMDIYNNTVVNNLHKGIYIRNAVGGISLNLKNNLVNNSGVSDYDISSFTIYNHSNNISDDTTSPDVSYQSKVVQFMNATNSDFHLSQSDTAAKNAGTDLSTYFTTDIDGATRNVSLSNWDIGADETATQIYRSVGPGATGILDSDNSHADELQNITSGVATFEVALVDNIGVGDVLIYDSNASETITSADTLLFIHGRTDATHYTVRTQTGAIPSDVAATNDTWQIYRAYTSLANAEAGTKNTSIPITFNGGNRDLVTNNEEWNIACYANGTTVDSTAVTIDGWNTFSQNFIKVYTPALSTEVGVSQRHSGKWDDNKYNMKFTTTSSWQRKVNIINYYVILDGLQIELSYNHSYVYAIEVGGNHIVSNSIVKGEAQGSDIKAYGINIGGGYNDKVFNNIVYGFKDQNNSSGEGIRSGYIYDRLGDYIYNNTVYDSYVCFQEYGGGSTYLKNNIAQNCTVGYSGDFYSSSDFNISDISGDAPNATFTGGTANVLFIDEANDDFRLSWDDTAAKKMGLNLSADANLSFTDDIRGQARPKSPDAWSIGACENLDKQKIKFEGTKVKMEGDIKFE